MTRKRPLRNWLRRLVQRLMAWFSRRWLRLQRWLAPPPPNPLPPIALAPPPPSPTSQITQTSEGDRNVVIGIAEAGSSIAITYGSSPLPSGEPNPFGVPYPRNPYFTGRQSVLEHLHQQLTQTPIAVINGLGGIGKTQTAVEYAYRYVYDHPTYDTVFWVKADTEANLITSFANLADQLALPAAQLKQEEKLPAVQTWLATHNHWLLIFDNADHPDWLIPLMPNNPQGKVLLTSRATIFDQLGIETPAPLDVLSPSEALDLLFKRTQRQRTESELAAATQLNQELDGLPLALEQASAYILRKRISFQTYLNTYRKHGLSQLEKVKAQTGNYPASVATTWALNVEAVAAENPAAAELLTLSAFLAPDDIPYQILLAGAAELGDPLSTALAHADSDEALLAISELLYPLSQYSLIRWDGDRQCYSVHRLVQAVVRDRLAPETQALWLARVTAALAYAYPGGEFQHWPRCAHLLPHWLRIVDQAHQSAFASEALATVLNQAGFYLRKQGRYGEAEPFLVEALALRQQLLGESHPDVARSLANLAELYRAQGRYREAEPLYVEALAMRKQLLGDSHPDVALSLNNLALLYKSQGRYGEAEPLYIEALAIVVQQLGQEHPNTQTVLDNFVTFLHQVLQAGQADTLSDHPTTQAILQQLRSQSAPD